MSAESHPYGYARGLSTAEKLTLPQVAALKILREATEDGARSSNRNHGLFVATSTAESLTRLGLAERVPGQPRRWYQANRYQITKIGRAILNGREKLDQEESARAERRRA